MGDSSTEALGSEPETVFTDSLKAYREEISTTFNVKPEHVAKCGIAKPHTNNNRIERLSGTLRERVKVQRGYKSMTSQITEGQRIQYNFIKPHMALEGQTPAEKAGIGVMGKDKWMDLLEHALKDD